MNKDEALKMAIKEMETYAFKHECDYQCKDNELIKAINACKEALKPHSDCDEACMFQCQMEKQHGMTYEQGFDHGWEARLAEEQPAQEPVAWMHYKDFTIVMHDVWEELLDGKDDWYPLYMEQSQPNKLQQVVIEHIKDLRKCAPALRMYKEMNQTANEVEKAANELEQALTHPHQWQGLTDDEIDKIADIIPTNYEHDFARAIEAKLKEKNT